MRSIVTDFSTGQKRYFVCGEEVSEARYFGRRVKAKAVVGTGNWKNPIASDAAGVSTTQIPEAIELSKKLGVPTDYSALGQPIFVSSAHRRKYLKAFGYTDRSSYY